MRNKIRELIAQAGTTGGLRQAHVTRRVLASKPKAQLTDSDILKLTLREVAVSRGIPQGFHRWPTQEEYAQLEVAKREERPKLNKVLEQAEVKKVSTKDEALEKLLQTLGLKGE